jgi:SAM-dependent methyltransferase
MAEVVFDEAVAATYDTDSADMFDPGVVVPAVELLTGLAGGGAALEFGIGTGRIALPLAAAGVIVEGIDISAPMVERLRAKPGGDAIPVTNGDFATVRSGGTYRLVYCVWNALANLVTQDAQVDCFANAAAQLEPGGHLVVEVGFPDLRRVPAGETARAFTLTPARLGFDTFDLASQLLTSHHYWLEDGGLRTFQSPCRYVYPSELDLMARLAGLRLAERWSGWTRAAFDPDSTENVVSVWHKPS